MRVGFIGWRGMVGSVLRERMEAEGDLDGIEVSWFSTSQAGLPGPDGAPLYDAADLAELAALDVVITCQGGAWTEATWPALRHAGWNGFWIDAASTLRMHEDATLVLDPVNGDAIRRALHGGAKTFVGSNCTVGLMLMGLVGLIRTGEVEWISTMTYQSASGGGARHIRELVAQMAHVGHATNDLLTDPAVTALQLDRRVRGALASPELPTEHFGAPLAGSALPWIDRDLGSGQTREEWKAMAEANKLLDLAEPLPVDGLCVRIGAMRCHAQALTIKLRRAVPLDEVQDRIRGAHPWVDVIPNNASATLAELTPAAVAGTLRVPVGRLRRLSLGPDMLTCFTVGDQLLWGAAEPLRRMLRILRE